MVHIQKIKTWYGMKWAVVELYKYYTVQTDRSGKAVKSKGKVDYEEHQVYHAVEYGKDKNIRPAIFDLTPEGLNKAREVQALFNQKAGVK